MRFLTASYCPRSKALSTNLMSSFLRLLVAPVRQLLLAVPSSHLSLSVSSNARLLPAVHGLPSDESCKTNLVFVISCRDFVDSCSNHGSERFFIKPLQAVKVLDFFKKCLAARPAKPYLRKRYGTTHLRDHFIVRPCITSPTHHIFAFFLYGDILLLLLPPCFCSAVPLLLFRVALSLSLAPMLFSARKSAIASSSSKIFFCVSSPTSTADTCDVLKSAVLFNFFFISPIPCLFGKTRFTGHFFAPNLLIDHKPVVSSVLRQLRESGDANLIMWAEQGILFNAHPDSSTLLQNSMFLMISHSRALLGGFASSLAIVARRSVSIWRGTRICSAELTCSKLLFRRPC